MEDDEYQEEDQEEPSEVVLFESQNSGTIYNELKLSLPSYLENLLLRSGFDSLETVRLINREVIDEVEEFARLVYFVCIISCNRIIQNSFILGMISLLLLTCRMKILWELITEITVLVSQISRFWLLTSVCFSPDCQKLSNGIKGKVLSLYTNRLE